ncbi:MAG: hypothetical protein ACQKBV_06125 [Puniceicoccales bacterium]
MTMKARTDRRGNKAGAPDGVPPTEPYAIVKAFTSMRCIEWIKTFLYSTPSALTDCGEKGLLPTSGSAADPTAFEFKLSYKKQIFMPEVKIPPEVVHDGVAA